jgi:hypothetical protein
MREIHFSDHERTFQCMPSERRGIENGNYVGTSPDWIIDQLNKNGSTKDKAILKGVAGFF